MVKDPRSPYRRGVRSEEWLKLKLTRTQSVVIGGILSSTLLTLLVLPVLYRFAHRREADPDPVPSLMPDRPAIALA